MKKTFAEWEKEVGAFAHNPSAFGSKTMTKEEFLDIFFKNRNEFSGVNYHDRVKFLESNGYEVTRENLMDGNLSAKTQEE